MLNPERDPIVNVVHDGIKEGIRVTLDNKCYPSTIKLVLSAIDTMAYLKMPKDKVDVEARDFVEWVDKYIQFPCKERLTGLDLYGARCGMLHSHKAISKASRKGKCRIIGYMDHSVSEIRCNRNVDANFVLVSVKALVEAFFTGIDRSLVDIYSNKKKGDIANERFKEMVHSLPYKTSKFTTC
ncbi:MAG: hypothetical protein HYY14_05065 [Candidatus Omnitrophica bacterium]|nr:hypothetical protein [Candidatus Omnitrophota bacterium]